MEADPKATLAALPPPLQDPSLFVANPSAALLSSIPGVERGIAESLAKETLPAKDPRARNRSISAALAAVFASVAGHHNDARRFVAIAREGEQITARADNDAYLEDLDHDPLAASRTAAFAAAVELAAGDLGRAEELLAAAERTYRYYPLEALHDFLARRDVDKLATNYLGWNLVEDGVNRPFNDAAAGLGKELADALRASVMDGGPALRLGAPLLKSDQGLVVAWMRDERHPLGWYRSPADQLVHFRDFAAAAAALGDPALSEIYAARAARFEKALLRRDIAVPLAVLERL
jgi:hypothetical protein